MNPLQLAIMFHETYERLAPSFGYETREDTKKFDENSKNGRLMVAVCGEILSAVENQQGAWMRCPLCGGLEMVDGKCRNCGVDGVSAKG